MSLALYFLIRNHHPFIRNDCFVIFWGVGAEPAWRTEYRNCLQLSTMCNIHLQIHLSTFLIWKPKEFWFYCLFLVFHVIVYCFVHLSFAATLSILIRNGQNRQKLDQGKTQPNWPNWPDRNAFQPFVNISEVNRQAIYRTRSAGQNISQYIGFTTTAQRTCCDIVCFSGSEEVYVMRINAWRKTMSDVKNYLGQQDLFCIKESKWMLQPNLSYHYSYL